MKRTAFHVHTPGALARLQGAVWLLVRRVIYAIALVSLSALFVAMHFPGSTP